MAISNLPPGAPASDEHPADGGTVTFTLPDDRCIKCGTTEGPLHPGEPEPMGPGVERDTAVCTAHLEPMTPLVMPHYWEPDRYEPKRMPADERGISVWGVVDHTKDDAWVEDVLNLEGTVGPLTFPTFYSARDWIGRIRYLTEGRARAVGQ